MREFIDALEKTYKAIDHVVVAFAIALIALLFLFLFSEIALGQNKFFGTPNRGVEGGKGNAQIKALNDSSSQNRADIQALQNTIDSSLTAVIGDVGTLQAAVDASLTAVSDCGNLGMLGGPDHPTANAQDCLPGLIINPTGAMVFSEPTRHLKSLVLGDNPTCNASNEGMLRYISAQKSVMLCTGTTWIEVGAAPAASGVFTPVTNANLGQSYTSNSVSLSGFFGTRTATATNGAIILVNGVSRGNSANVQAGDSVALRMTSSATFNTAKSTTLSLSSYSQTWTVTTRMQDTTPNSFSVANLTNQALSTQVQSAAVTVSGFDGPLTVSVSGAGSPQLQVAGGAWVTSAAINPGQSLRLRLTTSGSYSTAHSATVSLGTFSTSWSATTGTVSYSSWSGWSSCSASCGGGTQTRTRTCQFSGGGAVNCSFCGGVCSQSQACNTQGCGCSYVGQPFQGGKCAQTGTNALISANADNPIWDWSGAKSKCTAMGAGWYLPSSDELYQLYQAKGLIGGFNTSWVYWSSTQLNFGNAVGRYFANGAWYNYNTGYIFGSRCVRRAN